MNTNGKKLKKHRKTKPNRVKWKNVNVYIECWKFWMKQNEKNDFLMYDLNAKTSSSSSSSQMNKTRKIFDIHSMLLCIYSQDVEFLSNHSFISRFYFSIFSLPEWTSLLNVWTMRKIFFADFSHPSLWKFWFGIWYGNHTDLQYQLKKDKSKQSVFLYQDLSNEFSLIYNK